LGSRIASPAVCHAAGDATAMVPADAERRHIRCERRIDRRRDVLRLQCKVVAQSPPCIRPPTPGAPLRVDCARVVIPCHHVDGGGRLIPGNRQRNLGTVVAACSKLAETVLPPTVPLPQPASARVRLAGRQMLHRVAWRNALDRDRNGAAPKSTVPEGSAPTPTPGEPLR